MSEKAKAWDGDVYWADHIAPHIAIYGVRRGNDSRRITGPVYKGGDGRAVADHDEMVKRWNAHPGLLAVAKAVDALDLCEGYTLAESDLPKLWAALSAARDIIAELEGRS
jgi:hypothetical protein